MSSFLYAVGRAAYRRRGRALVAWLLVLLLALAAAGGLGDRFEEEFSLPGTESQTALDALNRNFPQAAGTTAQVILVAPEGASVRDASTRSAIERAVGAYERIDQVAEATSPFDRYAKGVIAADNSAAIISIRLDDVDGPPPATLLDAITAETDALRTAIPGSQASAGGEAFNNNVPGFSITEMIGVLVALVVLFLTLGSLRAAGMPLLTALLGVAITVLLIFGATGLAVVSSTTPLLAVMLGLAVGIDYALFIVSRHRDQLSGGLDPEESTARAVATAGSAVVFAGLTVMIALVGLSVAGIPFLTTMGIAAAIGVGVAVLIALTLLPALLGFAGAKLRPRERAPRRSSRTSRRAQIPAGARVGGARVGGARVGGARRWVRLVTRWPALTIAVVVVALGTLAYPAKDLRIALPDNGQAPVNTPARTTYDLVSGHFGVGYNGPLVVAVTLVASEDPLTVMDGIAEDIRALPGVASVPVSTPNEDASFGIVQVIPTSGPDAQATKDLVLELRSLKGSFADRYDVPAAVTGFTAVAIDISDRLGGALLPFGVIVVGLSLVLLAMVFRSVAVPIKATVGYLLSVLAAFGATAVVFEWGWFAGPLHVAQTAPVISFLPILLMGILFGLAMDYEVFLVSRMREEYVHNGDARAAIENGFVASSRVVVAAAVIMFAVFAAFVPEGDGAIKTIAFGLAVGVFVDAFVVRMTLVPAVLALLGHRAWWLPRWLDRVLPSFDVEGAGLTHQVALAGWPSPEDRRPVIAEGVPVPGAAPVSLAVAAGEVVVVDGPDPAVRSALLLTLAGRMRAEGGRMKIAGQVLPEQAGGVRARTGFVDGRTASDLRSQLRAIRTRRPAVVFVDHADLIGGTDDRAALASLLEEAAGDAPYAVVLSARDRGELSDLLPPTFSYLSVGVEREPAYGVAH